MIKSKIVVILTFFALILPILVTPQAFAAAPSGTDYAYDKESSSSNNKIFANSQVIPAASTDPLTVETWVNVESFTGDWMAIFTQNQSDAFGSLLGLAHALQDRGQTPSLHVEGGMIPMYRFLPGNELVQDIPDQLSEKADVFVVLDTSTRERVGKKTATWKQPVDLVIDHHVSNPGFGILNLIVPEIPATAGVLFRLFEMAGWKISPATATCLYAGLSTDTGSFRYRGTDAATLRIAASLVELGADPSEIAKHCYLSVTPERYQLKKLTVETLSIKDNKKSGFLTIYPIFIIKVGQKVRTQKELLRK